MMEDPLSLLRHYHVNKKEIIERDNQIIFGEFSWPKNAKTSFLISGSGKDGSSEEYYTLECLLFILKKIHVSHPVYVRQAAAANILAVRRPDRKELISYLKGETALPIDKSPPLETPSQDANILAVHRPDSKEQTAHLKSETPLSIDKSPPSEMPSQMLDTGESFIVKLRGLPYTTTEENVLDFLSGVRVLNGRDGIHLTETRPGRASGECFVELETADDLALVCGKDKEHMGKRYIEVFTSDRQELEWSVKHSANGSAGGGPNISKDAGAVKLRGLPFGCSKDEIAQFFIGLEILPDGISILSDQSGRSSGEAFVLFANAFDARAALQRDREKIGHRYIEVFMSSPDDVRTYTDRNSRGNGYGGGFSGRGGRPAPYDRPNRFDDRPSPRGNNRFAGGGAGGPMRGGPQGSGDSGGGNQVHMRGLPFKATPGDIAYFFQPIRPAKINILYEADRPSGEAVVDFECHEDAVQAMRKDKSNMEHRYIELFLNSSPSSGGRMGGLGMRIGGGGGFARNNYRNNY